MNTPNHTKDDNRKRSNQQTRNSQTRSAGAKCSRGPDNPSQNFPDEGPAPKGTGFFGSHKHVLPQPHRENVQHKPSNPTSSNRTNSNVIPTCGEDTSGGADDPDCSSQICYPRGSNGSDYTDLVSIIDRLLTRELNGKRLINIEKVLAIIGAYEIFRILAT